MVGSGDELMSRKELGPASMQVAQAVREVSESAMLIACSGGADSLALAVGAAWWGRRSRVGYRAIVIDHQLQPDSDLIAARAVEDLERIGVEAVIKQVTVTETGDGPEAAARAARYQALNAEASPGEIVLLGHTMDDQAETVLLGLARGSGTRSLAGMPAKRGIFHRPLLGITRETTRRCCEEAGLEPWEDPHNENTRYARVRVRKQVLPVMEDRLGPGIAEALYRTSLRCRQDADFLEELAIRAAKRCIVTRRLHCAETAKLPSALSTRVLLLWLRQHTSEHVSWNNVNSVLALVNDWHGQGPIQVAGIQITRSDGWLLAAPGVRR